MGDEFDRKWAAMSRWRLDIGWHGWRHCLWVSAQVSFSKIMPGVSVVIFGLSIRFLRRPRLDMPIQELADG